MIEITFVGTGSAVPPAGRGTTAFTVRTENMLLLADAGPSVFDGMQRAGIDPAEVTAIFLSHGHADHVLGFPQLALLTKIAPRNPPLKVFASAVVRETVTAVIRLTFPEATDALYRNMEWIELAEGPRQSYDVVEGVQLTSQVVFGPPYMPVLGLRLDFFERGISLAFSADTAPSDELASLATGCDLLIHEASFSATLEPDGSPEMLFHSDARQAGQIAARAGARQLVLTHVSRNHSDHRRVLTAEAAEFFKGPIYVPDDGDRLRLE